MLKDVSRHYSSRVRNMSHFFHVFLNNEKLPFILELSSNNQMYLSIINVMYSVPPNKQPYFSILTWSSCFCATGSHPSLLSVIVRSEHLFLSMIHSHTMTLRRASVYKQFSTMSCVKKIMKTLKCFQTQVCIWKQSKVSCQFWRKVSK